MTVGTVSTKLLTDIANAIRQQNGTSASYKPREMAAAVAALDGAKAGTAGVEGYKEVESGVLSSKVFDAIGGKVSQSFIVDEGGYASEEGRPHRGEDGLPALLAQGCGHHEHRVLVQRLLEPPVGERVREPERCGGRDPAVHLVQRASHRGRGLVRQLQDQEVHERSLRVQQARGRHRRLCAVTLLRGLRAQAGHRRRATDPESDIRTWLDATLFADGELKIGFAKADGAGREVLAAGKLCASAKYNASQATPWASFGKSVKAVAIAADASRLANVNLNYWFYGRSALASVSGIANLRGVARLDHAFNSCSALAELDLRGMSPATLASMAYTFGACTSLAEILVDADWELPKGCTGSSTFYNCKAIVDGNGTAYDSKQTTCAMCRIDREGQAGYLTAK